MSKNSFTKNFNNCVAGLPIASVAAHMILHEGLLKDLGKLGALAGIGYLGYNYGDEIGNLANKAGDLFGANDTDGANAGTNAVGRALTGAHNWMKNAVEDNAVGRYFNVGGDRAFDQQHYNNTLEDLNTRATAAHNSRIGEYKNLMAAGKISQADYDYRVDKENERYRDNLEQNQVRATEMTRSNAAKGDKDRGIAGHELQHNPTYYHYDEKGQKLDTPVTKDQLHYAQKQQFIKDYNQKKSNFLANKAEGAIETNMTGDGTFIPPAPSKQQEQPVQNTATQTGTGQPYKNASTAALSSVARLAPQNTSTPAPTSPAPTTVVQSTPTNAQPSPNPQATVKPAATPAGQTANTTGSVSAQPLKTEMPTAPTPDPVSKPAQPKQSSAIHSPAANFTAGQNKTGQQTGVLNK